MNTFVLLAAIALLLLGCDPPGSNSTPNYVKSATTVNKGLELIAKSDCMGCHRVAAPSTGPSYAAIGQKYLGKPDAENLLANKIIKGSSGVWGAVPMLPHPQISPENAKEMARYILSTR